MYKFDNDSHYFPAPNDNQKIWRYMDFTKFVSLLDKQALFFTRIDKFEDPFEGQMPKAKNPIYDIIYPDGQPEDLSGDLIYNLIKTVQTELSYKMRNFTIANCWHINDYESDAMWKLYLKSNEGIAIQSTYKRLCTSFCSFETDNILKDNTLIMEKIKYIDYDEDSISASSVMYPFIHKQKCYEHERELRALINLSPENIDEIEYGYNVPVDLNILIEKIYISPTAPLWFKELVISILKKYNLEKEVIHSHIYKYTSINVEEERKKLSSLANREKEAKKYISLANREIQSKNYDKAKYNFMKAIQTDPNNPISYLCYGIFLKEFIKKYEDAIDNFNKAIKLDSHCFHAYYCLGCIYLTPDFNLNNEEIAEKYFNKVLQLNETYEDAYYNLSCIYIEKNNTSKAFEYLKKACKLNDKFKRFALNDDNFKNVKETREFQQIIC